MTLKKLILAIFIPLCALFTLIQIAVNTVSAAGVGAMHYIFGGFSIFLIVMGFIQALLFLGVSAMLYFCLYEKEEPRMILWGSLGFTIFCYIFLILYFIGGETGDGVVSIFGFIIGLILTGYGFGLLKELELEGYFARMHRHCCCGDKDKTVTPVEEAPEEEAEAVES